METPHAWIFKLNFLASDKKNFWQRPNTQPVNPVKHGGGSNRDSLSVLLFKGVNTSARHCIFTLLDRPGMRYQITKGALFIFHQNTPH